MSPAIFGLTLAAALGSALVAGVFFAFSTFVMDALDRIPPAQGINAMNQINETVLRPGFMIAFVGTAIRRRPQQRGGGKRVAPLLRQLGALEPRAHGGPVRVRGAVRGRAHALSGPDLRDAGRAGAPRRHPAGDGAAALAAARAFCGSTTYLGFAAPWNPAL
jgi:hypothetical protein